MIKRIPRRNVKYDQSQPSMTEIRLRTPTRKATWTAPHSHHAKRPESLRRPRSAIAALRPIVATLPQHYIVRTSWVIGDGNNFVRTMASLAERGVDPSVVDDLVKNRQNKAK